MPISRCTLFGWETSQSSQSSSSAGTSEGADAATTANSNAAAAAPPQDWAALIVASTSQGSSTWAMAAPRWPVVSEPRNGGASIQRAAAMMGSQGRALNRRPQNQAPMAASGRAAT